jgi:hypothetical protein
MKENDEKCFFVYSLKILLLLFSEYVLHHLINVHGVGTVSRLLLLCLMTMTFDHELLPQCSCICFEHLDHWR